MVGTVGRHNFYPYFEGLSSKSFEQYRLEENEEYYNLTQEQRHNERKIREWDRRNEICKAANVDNSKEQSKIREWKNRQKQFLEENPSLKRDYAREKSHVKTFDANTIKETKNAWLESGYNIAVNRGSISPFVTFETYQNISKHIDNELIGLELPNGIVIEKYSKHLIDRIIGQYKSSSEPLKGKRQGVEFDYVLECLKKPINIGNIKADEKGRKSIICYGKQCIVSVNPVTKEVIQVNPIGKKKVKS